MSYADETIDEIQNELRHKRKIDEAIDAGLWDSLRKDVQKWYMEYCGLKGARPYGIKKHD